MVARSIVFVALLSIACGGSPAEPGAAAPSTPSATPTAAAPPADSGSVAAATAAPSAAPAPADPGVILLDTFGVRMTAPSGWTVQRSATSATVKSPSGKSGFIFYAVDDPTHASPFLQAAEDAFHVSMPLGMGKMWAAPSGLKFLRTDKGTTTSEKSKATATILLGTSPSVPGSSVGVLGVVVDHDGDAKAELESALGTLAPR